MQLRALFYARLGALSRERKELLRQAPAGATQTAAQASTRLADINTLAQQLHDNSAAEFKTYMQHTSAYRRGVRLVLRGLLVHQQCCRAAILNSAVVILLDSGVATHAA